MGRKKKNLSGHYEEPYEYRKEEDKWVDLIPPPDNPNNKQGERNRAISHISVPPNELEPHPAPPEPPKEKSE